MAAGIELRGFSVRDAAKRLQEKQQTLDAIVQGGREGVERPGGGACHGSSGSPRIGLPAKMIRRSPDFPRGCLVPQRFRSLGLIPGGSHLILSQRWMKTSRCIGRAQHRASTRPGISSSGVTSPNA